MNSVKVLKFIFILFAVFLFESCSNVKCEVCGDYKFEMFEEESVFSDSEIADILGDNKVNEYKEKLKSQPSLIYAMTIDKPEKIDAGEIRARIVIGIQSPHYGHVIYKGKVVTMTGEEVGDGIIRIEYRYNDLRSEYEQITFGNDQNILFYRVKEEGLLIRNGNSDEYGLGSLEDDLFIRD